MTFVVIFCLDVQYKVIPKVIQSGSVRFFIMSIESLDKLTDRQTERPTDRPTESLPYCSCLGGQTDRQTDRQANRESPLAASEGWTGWYQVACHESSPVFSYRLMQ